MKQQKSFYGIRKMAAQKMQIECFLTGRGVHESHTSLLKQPFNICFHFRLMLFDTFQNGCELMNEEYIHIQNK